jgi:urate oxidase
VRVEEHAWDRAPVGPHGHDHAFVRRGTEVRTAHVDVTDAGATVRSGLSDLVVLKSTGSAFRGFLRDDYTTLEETDDRVLATSLTATWTHGPDGLDRGGDWNAAYAEVRGVLLEIFATTYSRALQETLWLMGRAVLERRPDVAEISFVAPNKHHHLVDLSPFGIANDGEVFIAADRPYGLIEATVTRDDG